LRGYRYRAFADGDLLAVSRVSSCQFDSSLWPPSTRPEGVQQTGSSRSRYSAFGDAHPRPSPNAESLQPRLSHSPGSMNILYTATSPSWKRQRTPATRPRAAVPWTLLAFHEVSK
jgi:hypothetical protein